MATVKQVRLSPELDRKAHGEEKNGGLEKPNSATSEGKDPEVEQLENAQHPTKSSRRRQRIASHCAKFWLWWLLGVIVFLAVFLPCL